MIDLHPDIKIYIAKLQQFFNDQPHHYKEMFGDAKPYDTFKLIIKYAVANFREFEDPTLTVEQFEAVSAAVKKPTGIFHSFPPICLN